ncbi:hypothetical protein TRFO_19122 [Tritrichomonas foetus]|uniref:Uncharacterized protein n=1 Tax=Tritrichomonas foetus TaxID=1144522 RepID=A0A1J4KPP6_9EUKA|nr:hypothetical protein TRFO_19122 [Tritrichomonas foetus]|eukprot:OHT11397.1 hypothetical protein TRFO_19122 [Tritrichomonas foetus]
MQALRSLFEIMFSHLLRIKKKVNQRPKYINMMFLFVIYLFVINHQNLNFFIFVYVNFYHNNTTFSNPPYYLNEIGNSNWIRNDYSSFFEDHIDPTRCPICLSKGIDLNFNNNSLFDERLKKMKFNEMSKEDDIEKDKEILKEKYQYIQELNTKDTKEGGLETFYDLTNKSILQSLTKIQINEQIESTGKDIVLSCLFKIIVHSLNFVRTFRSTQSRARIILFVDDSSIQKMNSFMISTFERCQVHFINIGTLNPKYCESIASIRMILFYSFLLKYHYFINRVLIVDLTDTYFYGDPFTNDISSDDFILTAEGYTFSFSRFNFDWVQNVARHYGNNAGPFLNNQIINNGLLIGGIYPILSFYDQIFELDIFKPNFDPTFNDQGIVNYLYYFKNFSNNNKNHSNINITVIQPGKGAYQSMTGLENFFHVNQETFEVTIQSQSLKILHQFDRYCPLLQNIRNLCPSLGSNHQDAYPQKRHTVGICFYDNEI